MSITINSIIDTKNDFWEVSLAGELDVSTADELKKSLHKLVDEKNIDMKLNLENLKRLKIENKEVYIEKPKNNVRKIFNITGLDKVFKMEG